MGTKVSYPIEVKMKAIEMFLAGIPVKQVLEELALFSYYKAILLKTFLVYHLATFVKKLML